jgi:hypothetical protein
LTVTLVNGVATFSGLSYNVAETLNLSFSTNAGSFTATSNDIVVNPAAASQLVITQQPSASATAGVDFATQPVLTEEDGFGNIVTSDSTHTVTAARGNHGTGTLQGSNLTVTLVNGVATFSGLSYNVAETLNLSFSTNAGSFTATSNDIVVDPAAGSQLAITQQPSATATAGVTFATQPVVKEEDSFGNVIIADNFSKVTVARGNHGTGTLQGSNLTVTLVNGVATFSGLSYNVAETLNLSFSTTAGSFTSASNDIVVSPAAASQLVITQQPSVTATAGIAFATQPVVKEEDGFGNILTADNTSTVTVARGSHGTATLQGSNLTVTLVNGVAAFSGLSYDLGETINLGFSTNAGTFTATSNDIVVGVVLTVSTPSVTPTTSSRTSSAFNITGTFTDPAGTGEAPYTAVINWGDSTTSMATIGGFASPFSYAFQGNHTYNQSGTFTVTVSVTDRGGNTATSAGADVTVTITTPTPTPTAPDFFAVGAGPGGPALINVYDSATGALRFQFQAFETGFTGGVRVAVGRLHGQDIITAAAGPGGYLVRTFAVGSNSATPIAQFEPFGTFSGGIWVATGDLNGDGGMEIVTGPDAAPNCSPYITVQDVFGNRIGGNVPVFEDGFTGGVRVAVADLSGTGKNDIIGAAGSGGFPLVQIIDGRTFQRGARFQVFDSTVSSGVFVAGGMLDNSGLARLIVGAGGNGFSDGASVLREFDANGGMLHDNVVPFASTYHGGVDVAVALAFGHTHSVILATPANTLPGQVQVFDSLFDVLPQSFTIVDSGSGQTFVQSGGRNAAVTLVTTGNFGNGVFVS